MKSIVWLGVGALLAAPLLKATLSPGGSPAPVTSTSTNPATVETPSPVTSVTRAVSPGVTVTTTPAVVTPQPQTLPESGVIRVSANSYNYTPGGTYLLPGNTTPVTLTGQVTALGTPIPAADTRAQSMGLSGITAVFTPAGSTYRPT